MNCKEAILFLIKKRKIDSNCIDFKSNFNKIFTVQLTSYFLPFTFLLFPEEGFP